MSTEQGVAGGTGAGEFMLFGVRVVVDSMRKSVSLNNLSQYEHRLDSSSSNNINSDKDVGAGYASADEAVPNSSSAAVAASNGGRERKRGKTEKFGSDQSICFCSFVFCFLFVDDLFYLFRSSLDGGGAQAVLDRITEGRKR